MKKYLSYVLLGIMISFALLFIFLISINIYMSTSKIKFVPNEDYESKIEYLENILNEDKNDICNKSLLSYLNYSKDTYFASEITPYEWINKMMYRNTTNDDYMINIFKNCEIESDTKNRVINSYNLINYTINRITNDSVNNYKMGFGDIFTSYYIGKDISVYNYSVAKMEEANIIERVLKG